MVSYCFFPGCGRRLPARAVICSFHWALCPAREADLLGQAWAGLRALQERPQLESEPWRYRAAEDRLAIAKLAAVEAIRKVAV